MRKLILIIVSVLIFFTSSVAYSQNMICKVTSFFCKSVNFEEIIKKNGLYYKKYNSIPFTGKVIGKEMGFIQKGKKEGYWVGYNNNINLRYTVIFKNGEWETGSYNGEGTVTYENGDQYIGQFIGDQKYGQGTYTFSTGDKYIGEWKNTIRYGEGVYNYSNGNRYEGQFKDNK